MLFEYGSFTLHSNSISNWRINCENLTHDDWHNLVQIAIKHLDPFGSVEGIPTGGIQFANAFSPYISKGSVLIVDDVLTTGASMEIHRNNRKAQGIVAFARGPIPFWVTSIFTTLL